MSENDGTQDSAHVFTHNAGSVSQLPLWPQTHFIFINLFVVRFISPNGRDYSNLAWNASTSYVVTPFCNFQPPKGSRHEPHRLVHLHVLFILPNGDICLNLCLKQAFCTAPGARTLLSGVWGPTLVRWSGLGARWNAGKANDMNHGLSVQKSFGGSFCRIKIIQVIRQSKKHAHNIRATLLLFRLH